MSNKGILQRRTPEGVWVDVMPYVGGRTYLAVASASKVLGCAVRVKLDPTPEPDGGAEGA